MAQLLTFFTIFITAIRTQRMCQFYQNGELYDITNTFPSTTVVEVQVFNKMYNVSINLCKEIQTNKLQAEGYKVNDQLFSEDIKPNSFIINTEDKEATILSHINTNTYVAWRKKIDQKTKGGFGPTYTQTVIEIKHVIHDIHLLQKFKIQSIKYILTCSPRDSLNFRDSYFNMETREIIMTYTGSSSCHLEVKDYVSFLSRNLGFLAILFFSSVIGLLLDKSKERMVMSIASLQAGVMITTAVCIASSNYVNQTDGEYWFSVAASVAGVCFFGFSYFSRIVAVPLVCISLSYTVSWTLLYIVTVAFKFAIDFQVFLLVNFLVFLSILLLSMLKTSLREKYSYGIYTSITYPFFLCLSVSIYFRKYLDVITYSKYRDWGRDDDVTVWTWISIPIQLMISLILIYFRCWKDMEIVKKEMRFSMGHREVTRQKLIDDDFGKATIISM